MLVEQEQSSERKEREREEARLEARAVIDARTQKVEEAMGFCRMIEQVRRTGAMLLALKTIPKLKIMIMERLICFGLRTSRGPMAA